MYLKGAKKPLIVICTYRPVGGANKSTFKKDLKDFILDIQKQYPSDNYLIGGDWNMEKTHACELMTTVRPDCIHQDYQNPGPTGYNRVKRCIDHFFSNYQPPKQSSHRSIYQTTSQFCPTTN